MKYAEELPERILLLDGSVLNKKVGIPVEKTDRREAGITICL